MLVRGRERESRRAMLTLPLRSNITLPLLSVEVERKGCDMFRQSSKVSRLASNIMKWYTVQEKMVVFSAADIHAKIMDDS